VSSYYFDAFPLPKLIQPEAIEIPFQSIRSLHIYGNKDQVINKSKSQELCKWMGGESVSLDSGHSTPPSEWCQTALLDWIDNDRAFQVEK